MPSGFTFGSNAPNAPAFGQTASFGSAQPLNLAPASTGLSSTFAANASKGFNFSAPQTTSAPNTFGTLNFNSPAPTQGGFGAPSGGGFGFNAPPATGATFGSTLTSQPSTMFGSVAPNTTTPFGAAALASSGLAFGAAPANAAFGMSTFGTAPAASSAPTALAFPAPAPTMASAGGFGLGPPAAATGGLTFGAPASTATGLSFGAPAATAAGGLTFGTPAASTAGSLTFGTAAAGLTFGAPAASGGGGLSFGAPAATSAGGLTFGAPAANAATNLTFPSASVGLTQPTAPGLTLQASNTLTFGAPLTSASAPAGATFGTPLAAPISTGLQFPSTTATPLTFSGLSTPSTTSFTPAASTAPNLLLGTSAAPLTAGFGALSASSVPNTSLNFNLNKTANTTAAATMPSLGLGIGLNKLPQTSALAFPGLGAATSTSATTDTPKVGLGGVSVTPPKQPSTTLTGQVEIAPRDQALPNEILQSVEQFKKHLQEQKNYMSEISRFSIDDFKKIESDIEVVNKRIGDMENELQTNRAVTEKLKLDSSKGLKHAELAQRTFDTLSGLQYDNTAPLAYFIELTDNFERQMQLLKVHIDNITTTINNVKPSPVLTCDDLALGMRRIHETFVALAGRLQSLHNQVEIQKEEYLELRKNLFKDYTNVFEHKSKELEALEFVLGNANNQSPVILTGPTPFNSLGNSHAQILALNQQQVPPPPAYPISTGGAPIPGFSLPKPSTIPLFGNISSTNLSFNNSPNTSFQLQKPPIGNKRGKS